jgi:ferredoxin-like protein FixX
MENQNNQNEIRIILTEDKFTYICKVGHFTHRSPQYGNIDIHFTKKDIIELVSGKILSKEIVSELFKFALQDLGIEYTREIIKRSPLFYELSTQF